MNIMHLSRKFLKRHSFNSVFCEKNAKSRCAKNPGFAIVLASYRLQVTRKSEAVRITPPESGEQRKLQILTVITKQSADPNESLDTIYLVEQVEKLDSR